MLKLKYKPIKNHGKRAFVTQYAKSRPGDGSFGRGVKGGRTGGGSGGGS